MEPLVIERLSKSAFESPDKGHLITYDRVSKYITCNCAEFGMFGKCVWVDSAQATLESEGVEVHRRRPPKNIFATSEEIFNEAVEKIGIRVYSAKDFV